MVKAIMHGCNGKMGQVISGLVKEDDVIEPPSSIRAHRSGATYL